MSEAKAELHLKGVSDNNRMQGRPRGRPCFVFNNLILGVGPENVYLRSTSGRKRSKPSTEKFFRFEIPPVGSGFFTTTPTSQA